jgi:hypothetical protein
MNTIILMQRTHDYHFVVIEGRERWPIRLISIVGQAEIPVGKRKSFFRRRKWNTMTVIFSRISSVAKR